MNDSQVSSPPWLLLIHQLPPKPDYLRVKVRRRLHKLGAVPLRGSVYVLPRSEAAQEDFQWLLREIQADGGEAMICEASFIGGLTDAEVDAMFEKTGKAAESVGDQGTERVVPGRTWVTRRGVHIDRMASAWLIRRFIDPEARFRFVASRGYRPEPGELRFDMFDAEYAHEGEQCTFQVLASRFGVATPAIAALGEVVRDIDCKDLKFARPETSGVSAVIGAIAAGPGDDEFHLEQSAPVFEGLLRHFSERSSKEAAS